MTAMWMGMDMTVTLAGDTHKFKQSSAVTDKLPLCTTSGACARCARSPSTAR
jgi:hypothetical protein